MSQTSKLNTARWMVRVDRLNQAIGRALAVVLLVMLPVQLAAVVSRQVFSLGLPYLGELVWYLNAACFMLGIGWVMANDGHVRVDVFYAGWPARRQALVNLAGYGVMALTFALVTWAFSLDFVAAAWRVTEGSAEMHGLPLLFLLKTIIPVSAVLIALQALAEAARAFLTLRNPETRNLNQHD